MRLRLLACKNITVMEAVAIGHHITSMGKNNNIAKQLELGWISSVINIK